jgi:hypothetical protein
MTSAEREYNTQWIQKSETVHPFTILPTYAVSDHRINAVFPPSRKSTIYDHRISELPEICA